MLSVSEGKRLALVLGRDGEGKEFLSFSDPSIDLLTLPEEVKILAASIDEYVYTTGKTSSEASGIFYPGSEKSYLTILSLQTEKMRNIRNGMFETPFIMIRESRSPFSIYSYQITQEKSDECGNYPSFHNQQERAEVDRLEFVGKSASDNTC